MVLKADGEGFGVDTSVTGVSLKIIRKSISAKKTSNRFLLILLYRFTVTALWYKYSYRSTLSIPPPCIHPKKTSKNYHYPIAAASAEERIPTNAIDRHGVALIGLQILPTEGLEVTDGLGGLQSWFQYSYLTHLSAYMHIHNHICYYIYIYKSHTVIYNI